jgi:hypothetical protein
MKVPGSHRYSNRVSSRHLRRSLKYIRKICFCKIILSQIQFRYIFLLKPSKSTLLEKISNIRVFYSNFVFLNLVQFFIELISSSQVLARF